MTFAASLSTNASWTESCTNSRLPAQQHCPWFRYMPSMAPSTAASRSASAKTMFGLLPPSSKVIRFSVVGGVPHDDLAVVALAGEGDLVDAGVLHQGVAGGLAEAGDDVDDPGGEAGLQRQLAEPEAGQRGLLGGLETTVQPAASAGPHFQATISIGKFQGMICPATPTGSRLV